jgi:hypothetical protein
VMRKNHVQQGFPVILYISWLERFQAVPVIVWKLRCPLGTAERQLFRLAHANDGILLSQAVYEVYEPHKRSSNGDRDTSGDKETAQSERLDGRSL